MRHLPTAGQTAMLVNLNLQRYAQDRGKLLGRFRMARSSIRNIAIRTRLEESWISEFCEFMSAEYGWLTFVDSEQFIFLKAESTTGWTKLATKRCSDIISRLRVGDSKALSDAESELEMPEVPPDEEEEE